MTLQRSWLLSVLGLVLLLLSGWLGWQYWFRDSPLLGLAYGNGRIEATEIDIATKLAGRIERIEVDEGNIVQPGQLLASMDTRTLEAQLHQAKAQAQQANHAIKTTQARVVQRQSEQLAAQARIAQHEAELVAGRKRYQRTQVLTHNRAMSQQDLDDARANLRSIEAALAAAKAQELSAQAAIDVARSEVIEAESALKAAQARVESLQADIDDSQLRAHQLARVQYRIAEPGEVLAAGGKLLNLIDLSDVYMTFFLPTREAGQVRLGHEARLVLDAFPDYVIPAQISFVAGSAQFTPKSVETRNEREKLMFRVKANIPPKLLHQHLEQIKTGLPGVAYVRLDSSKEWPSHLQLKKPQ